jgi:tRNA pseudouridine38-40 synthase
VKLQRYKLIVAFDGAGYEGWQAQKTGTGVQQKIEEALAKLFPAAPRVHGSSRTDTGVHARAMAAHFDIPAEQATIPPEKLLLALNAWLPEDVRVMRVTKAATEFHARFDAVAKEYRYQIWNHPVMQPLLRRTAWHVKRKLDLAAMRAAAKQFVGRHDFRSLRANPDYDTESTVRTIRRCEVRRAGPLFTVVIEGDGFLYKMCRAIAGTLAQVGEGKLKPSDIRAILERRDRRFAGMTAPAHGLTLWRVIYPPRRRNAAKRASAATAK